MYFYMQYHMIGYIMDPQGDTYRLPSSRACYQLTHWSGAHIALIIINQSGTLFWKGMDHVTAR